MQTVEEVDEFVGEAHAFCSAGRATAPATREPAGRLGLFSLVGATGIEPVTSAL